MNRPEVQKKLVGDHWCNEEVYTDDYVEQLEAYCDKVETERDEWISSHKKVCNGLAIAEESEEETSLILKELEAERNELREALGEVVQAVYESGKINVTKIAELLKEGE